MAYAIYVVSTLLRAFMPYIGTKSDIQFFAGAWTIEGSLKPDQALVHHRVIFRGHEHETRHRQIHSQQPEGSN